MEKNSEQTARMALESDGNVVGESFIVRPEKNLAAKLGVLFGVIEIYNTSDAFLDGLLGAISDLKTEYYLPPFNLERGVEKRLEEAIGRANRRILAAVNQSVEEIDLRNVSAGIGVFHGGKIYLSSAGRIKGLFCRRKKNLELLIMDILSGNGETRFRPEPDKIFANILSGELTERDGLLLINEEFLGVFSQKELAETVLSNPAPEAIRIIGDALREKVVKKNFYAVAITAQQPADIMPAAQAAVMQNPAVSTRPFRDPPAGGPTGRQNRNITDVPAGQPAKKTVPTQQSIDRLLFTQVKTEKYLTPSLLPQWQKILLVVWVKTKQSALFSARQLKKLGLAAATLIMNWQKQKPLKTNLEINTETAPEQPEQIESPRPAAGDLTASANHFLNAQIEKFLGLKRGQQIILILGLILIFLFSQSVVMIGRASDKSQTGASAGSGASKQIEDLLNSAEAQNIFNDEAGAVQSVGKAREILAQISDNFFNKTLKAELLAKIDATAKALQKINFLADPAVVADFSTSGTPADLIGLAKTGNIFWTYDNLSRTLYRLDPIAKKTALATTSLPSIKKLTAIDDKNLILSVDGKTFYKYDIAKRAAAKYKPAKDYFQAKLPAVASPLISPSLASSTINMSVISETYSFYLDAGAGRVVAVDKNGVLKRQFYSDKFKGAGSLAVAYKEKKLFIFNGGKVYQVNLDF